MHRRDQKCIQFRHVVLEIEWWFSTAASSQKWSESQPKHIDATNVSSLDVCRVSLLGQDQQKLCLKMKLSRVIHFLTFYSSLTFPNRRSVAFSAAYRHLWLGVFEMRITYLFIGWLITQLRLTEGRSSRNTTVSQVRCPLKSSKGMSDTESVKIFLVRQPEQKNIFDASMRV